MKAVFRYLNEAFDSLINFVESDGVQDTLKYVLAFLLQIVSYTTSRGGAYEFFDRSILISHAIAAAFQGVLFISSVALLARVKRRDRRHAIWPAVVVLLVTLNGSGLFSAIHFHATTFAERMGEADLKQLTRLRQSEFAALGNYRDRLLGALYSFKADSEASSKRELARAASARASARVRTDADVKRQTYEAKAHNADAVIAELKALHIQPSVAPPEDAQAARTEIASARASVRNVFDKIEDADVKKANEMPAPQDEEFFSRDVRAGFFSDLKDRKPGAIYSLAFGYSLDVISILILFVGVIPVRSLPQRLRDFWRWLHALRDAKNRALPAVEAVSAGRSVVFVRVEGRDDIPPIVADFPVHEDDLTGELVFAQIPEWCELIERQFGRRLNVIGAYNAHGVELLGERRVFEAVTDGTVYLREEGGGTRADGGANPPRTAFASVDITPFRGARGADSGAGLRNGRPAGDAGPNGREEPLREAEHGARVERAEARRDDLEGRAARDAGRAPARARRVDAVAVATTPEVLVGSEVGSD